MDQARTIVIVCLLCFTTWLFSCNGRRGSNAVAFTDSVRIAGIYKKGVGFYHAGVNDSALFYFRLGARESGSQHYIGLMGSGYYYMGQVYNVTGQNDSVRVYANKAIESLERAKVKDHTWLQARLMLVGNVANDQSAEVKTATELKILKDAGQIKDTIAMANILGNLSDIASAVNQSDQAINYRLEAVELLRHTKEKTGLVDNLDGLALLYSNSDQPKEALRSAQEALHTQETGQMLDSYPYTYSCIANAHMALHHTDSALYYLHLTDSINNIVQDPISQVNALVSYTMLYKGIGKYKEALVMTDKALVFAAAHDLTVLDVGLINDKSDELQGMGNYKEALRYKRMGDSIEKVQRSESTQRDITDLEKKYRTKEKEEQINALSAHVKLQRRQELLISVALLATVVFSVVVVMQYLRQRKAKQLISDQGHKLELLMKEIHHRIKNNLQIIISLINIQLRNRSTDDVEEMLADTKSRIQSIALLHQKLYQTDDVEHIAMQEYLEQLAKMVMALYADKQCGAEIRIDAGNMILDIDTSIPLGLIITELITNSFKHGDTTKTHVIEISIMQKGELYILSYKDNGPGLPAGLDINKSNTLGMQLVQLMCRQIGGTFTVEDTEGASFSIMFKNRVERRKTA